MAPQFVAVDCSQRNCLGLISTQVWKVCNARYVTIWWSTHFGFLRKSVKRDAEDVGDPYRN